MRNLSSTARGFSRNRKARACFLALTIIGVTLVFLVAPEKTSAVTRTWDGGGVDNNWDTPENWNPDGAPVPGDTVIFDATSVKDATINVNITVATIQINAGYSGTITQASGVTVTLSGTLTQADGTFNGGSGSIDLNGTPNSLLLSGGTFNSTTGTLFVAANFTHTAGGTFNHNGGTVTFDTINSTTIDVMVTETFNNLTIAGGAGFPKTIAAGDTLIVIGTLTLTSSSFVGGTIEAHAGVVHASTFSGGTVMLKIIGPATRTITLSPPGGLPNNILIDAANTVINTSGGGSLSFQTLNFVAGEIQQGTTAFTVNTYTQSGGTFTGGSANLTFGSGGFSVTNGGFSSTSATLTISTFNQSGGTINLGGGASNINTTVTLSGGTLNGSSGSIAVAGTWAQSGGTFNGGSGSIDLNGTPNSFTLTSGTFNSTTGTLFVAAAFTHTAGGTFNHNGGTVSFDSINSSTIDVMTTETFNNLTIAGGVGFPKTIPAGDTLIVTGTLTLSSGSFNGGTIEAQGNVVHAGGFGGSSGTLKIIGPATRAITLSPGGGLPNNILVDAASVVINTSGGGSLSFQTLNFVAGEIQQGTTAFTVNTYTQSGGTFTGGSANLTFGSGGFSVTNGGFSSTSATLTISTFNQSGGTINLGGGASNFNTTVTLSGGTLNGSSGSIAVAGTWAQSGGTFNGGSGSIDLNGTPNSFTLTSGTFNSTTGTLFVAAAFTHTAGGTFNHNGGTVSFDSINSSTIDVMTTETFNNLTIAGGVGFPKTIAAGDTLIVVGTLTLNTGSINSGILEVHGDMVVNAFSGGSAQVVFAGGAAQTYTNNGGANPTGAWTVNKSVGASSLTSEAITLTSNLSLGTSQAFNLTSGILDQGASFNLSVGPLTIGAAGVLKNHGTGDLTIAGSVSNGGMIHLDTAGPNCGDPDSILIRSNVTGTQRTWSGAGTFTLQDVDVRDQTGSASITVFNGTNTGNNGVNWNFDVGCAPTAITLVSFAASAVDDRSVRLEWQTGFEVNNLGFNVYREENGKLTRLNGDLVAGSALMVGADTRLTAGQSYEWRDSTVVGARYVAYWLEDVDLKGASFWHGPVYPQASSDRPQSTNSLKLTELADEKASLDPTPQIEPRAKAFLTTPAAMMQSANLAVGKAIKIGIRRAGWYRITQRELLSAGLDHDVDPRRLQLFVDGREVGIAVAGEGDARLDPSDAIEFYGVGLDTPSTDTRIYWLTIGRRAGLRVNLINGGRGMAAAESFRCTVERRDRSIYFAALRNGEKENFFGAIVAGSPTLQVLTLKSVSLSASADALLEVGLQGVTSLQHQVQIRFNDTLLGNISFDGRAEGNAKFVIPRALVREGDNVVALQAIGSSSDVNLVDFIRLTYQRAFRADDDMLSFTSRAGEEVTVTGFSQKDIRIFDTTEVDDVSELAVEISEDKVGYVAMTTVAGKGERQLLAVAGAGSSGAASLTANSPSAWRSKENAADFLVISQARFFDSLKPLVVLRSAQGFRVGLIDTEDIYDEFSFGQKSPTSLKDLLSYATAQWKVKPRWVLFFGDASFDARDYLGYGEQDLVPTKLIDTAYLETASDDWFADFDEDGLPDMAVGRLPVRTAWEAQVIVEKLLSDEYALPSNEATLVADRNDGFDFEQATLIVRAHIPSTVDVAEIFRARTDDATARRMLMDRLNRGQKLVNYMGHGSINLWRGHLLTSEDAQTLTNGDRLPLFVVMTCLNGYYHDPSIESMAESLLKAGQGGAIAVWASSGMTTPAAHTILNRELYDVLFAGRGQAVTLGEATRRAKAAVNNADIRRSWILFGDPTMTLK